MVCGADSDPHQMVIHFFEGPHYHLACRCEPKLNVCFGGDFSAAIAQVQAHQEQERP